MSEFFNSLILLLLPFILFAQRQDVNYEESRVPTYTLPELLRCRDGSPVNDAQTWLYKRRPEIYALFAEHVYGKMPEKRVKIKWQVLEKSNSALDGAAMRKQVRIFLLGKKEGPFMDLLLYTPTGEKSSPVFLGLNFNGNHTVIDDPAVRLPESWVPNDPKFGITDHRAKEANRGAAASRWPIREIIARGYGIATIYYGDIDPDDEGRFDNGIHPYFYAKGQAQPEPDEWGSISAWAWGLSRAMDYLENDPDVDGDKVIVWGHSRLGKTALWAGASDPRFAMVISNNSGCGGAALSRRRFGETLKIINTTFPHWFCDHFNRYNDAEDDLPVDQHMLIALIAPRPVYVASAENDLWADPRGEFLAAKYASPVYRLFGLQGLAAEEMPPVNQPVMGSIGYHIRSGGHDVTLYDWQRFMDFADLYF
ncbi:MAG: acetylxylan esterase [candidate division KSB1 bacterium]|nr:acetylxylan esterase [candidate division KSB1 bacterium]